jgi:hypothetical protein
LQPQVMLVGEQPGDQEDLRGQPFVGPRGQLLDRALRQLAVARDTVYLTNAVRHFRFELRGRRRIHKTRARRRPWPAGIGWTRKSRWCDHACWSPSARRPRGPCWVGRWP